MKRDYIIGIAILAVALAGCSKEDGATTDTWNGQIRLSSGITAQTRAGSDVPDKQIAVGKIVRFFVDDAGANVAKKNLYENYAMEADGNGGFTKNDPNAEDMYFPTTGNGVDIYAFVTNGFMSDHAFPTTALTHTVSSDQSEPYGSNYLSSDLLYAANKGVIRTPDAVQMNFYHLLSKVEVALKAGEGVSDLTGAVVTIENTQLKADFLPLKSAEINGTTAAAQAARATMVTPTTADNAVAPITIGTVMSTDFSAYASAVVVPQTVDKGKRFIKVKLASGGELYYTISEVGGLVLESGNKYRFQITVNLTGLTVKSIIADWATNTPTSGGAEMPEPKNSKDAAIGDYYMSDGTIWDKDEYLTPEQKAACIGIVYWKDSSNPAKGKVVGLTEAIDTMWSTELATTNANSQADGKANMEAIAQYIADNGKSWDDYPAFKWVAAKNGKPNGGWDAATDRWYLPAKEELMALYGDYSGDRPQNSDVKAAVNRSLNKLGAVQLSDKPYWPSTEYGHNPPFNAWFVRFNNGFVDYGSKDSDSSIRSIFAF